MYVYTPFVPKFAEYIERRDLKKFYSMTAKICVAIAAIGVLVIIAAAFLGEFALALVFGSSIVEYSYLLIPALISTAFTSLMGFFSMLEVVLRDFKGLIISNLIGLLLIVVCTPIMINSCGVNGTSYSLILSAGVVCAIQIIQIYFKGRTYGKNNEV